RVFAVTYLGLERHFVLIDKLEPRHMSSDEMDPTTLPGCAKIFYIIECRWQSQELKLFLRGLDEIYHTHVLTRGGGGNPFRQRQEAQNPKVVDGCAPEGLWRNCYDRDWLDSLKPYQRRELNIIDSHYNFDLTQEFDSDVVM
ncbi:uncharacterized protein BXZ73DRAFT_44417, partial [Epithele typhae]|uniref:uncharacterized protein n=1 Tax=Epithele typhae TaxID=378194 RepID=UPI0020079A69